MLDNYLLRGKIEALRGLQLQAVGIYIYIPQRPNRSLSTWYSSKLLSGLFGCVLSLAAYNRYKGKIEKKSLYIPLAGRQSH